MANTTADKLALLEATKADLKAALAEKGQTVGDVFSTYPAAVRAIETGGETATLTINDVGLPNVFCIFVNAEGSLIESDSGSPIGEFSIQVPSIVFVRTGDAVTSGNISEVARYIDLNSSRTDFVFLVTGNASIKY